MWHLPSLPYIYSSVFICLRHSYLQGKNLCKSIFSSSVFSPNVPHLRSRNHSLKHCTNSIFFYRNLLSQEVHEASKLVKLACPSVSNPFSERLQNIFLPCVGKFIIPENGNLTESIQKEKNKLKMQFHRISQENIQRIWNKVFKIH